jgi:hypothetical protein
MFVILWAGACVAQSRPFWKVRLDREMPLLGHRNWILVVDSAYPLQIVPGVETIETNASQEEVVEAVLRVVNKSRQVRPIIYLDAELPFVPDANAPGASAYRRHLGILLQPYSVTSRPHEQMIQKIDEAGKSFHILVLKTYIVIPYTSVFLQLDCKYWSAEAEQRLRNAMHTPKVP